MRRLVLLLGVLAALAAMEGARRPARAVGVLVCGFAMTNEVFGTVDVLPGSAVSTSATLTITCNGLSVLQNVYFCVAFPATTMTGPSTPALAYTLNGPPPAPSPWSNTTPIVFQVPLLGGSDSVAIPATLLGGQSGAPPGAYSQLVNATVQFGTTGCTTGVTATGSFSFSTTATVEKSCNVSADDLTFASVGDLDSPVFGQSQVNLQCSSGTGYVIALDGGSSGVSDPTQRKMLYGSNSVTYGLYRDAGHSLPWGSTPGGNTASGTGTALSQTVQVYGRVPIQATPPPATYTDTIVVSVTY